MDIFGEIRELCKNNQCKLYLCGLSLRQKKAFAKAGIKPDPLSVPRSKRQFVLFPDLDSGLGKAEDVLIKEEMQTSDILHLAPPMLGRLDELSGFHLALRHIDDLHGVEFGEGLLELERYTNRVELSEGQLLFEKDGMGGLIQEDDHGLFFIESGMIRVEQDLSDNTLSRTRSYLGTSALNKLESSIGRSDVATKLTLTGQHARLGTIARRCALAKRVAGGGMSHSAQRTARMGPGWCV